MSNNRGKGPPQAEDRTLLDPLNADELEALREARARMAAGRAGGAAPAPSPARATPSDEVGDAPTRAMMALPSFDSGGASLDALGPATEVPKVVADPKPIPQGGLRVPTGNKPAAAPPAGGAPSGSGPPNPAAGAQGQGPGFGENTLMWMAPVKLPEEQQVIPERGAAAAAGHTPTAADGPKKKSTALLVGGLLSAVVIGLAVFLFMPKGEPSVVELITNPGKATVKIDGKTMSVLTPMKATLGPGDHEIEINLEGHKPEKVLLTVESGAKPLKKELDLVPVSKPGLLTVIVNVQPVAANVTIDGTLYTAKRNVATANVDPKVEHKLAIEVGGYQKVEQVIPPGQLKETYNFILQPSAEK